MTSEHETGPSRIPVALQLYTVRDEFQRDPDGTLRAVAEIGYTAVELAGYGGMAAGQLRGRLDELGLRAISSHVPLADLRTRLDDAIEECRTLGCAYVVCPWLPPEQRGDAAGYRALAGELKTIARRCHERGLGFAYHNHDFELKSFDGEYALDILLGTAGAEVQSELDVYWAEYAGVNPASYIRRLGARCAIVHLKDMARDESRTFAEVGTGRLDFAAIFAASREAGVQFYVVEQDRCQRPPLESARMSLEQLRGWGIA